jgi:thiamine biosynthesis lipoprotein
MSETPADLTLFDVDFQAMGTRCTISLYAQSSDHARSVSEAVITDVARLESKYSRYLPDSLLSEINGVADAGGAITVDDETAALLDYAQSCFVESDGLFDITSGLLRRAWNFQPEGQTELPNPDVLAALLQRVGWDRLDWEAPLLIFDTPGMELDFGGIVKEYAVDRAVTLLKDAGVDHALINLGGDICVTGPRYGGEPWRVAISDPSNPESPLRLVALSHGALASSGSYARCIEIEGIKYGHLLNPRTGFPIAGTAAATVLADQCVVAGSLATIGLLKSPDARQFLEQMALPFLLIDQTGAIFDRLSI